MEELKKCLTPDDGGKKGKSGVKEGNDNYAIAGHKPRR